MFEGLTGRLGDIFTKLRGRGALTEEDVVAALRVKGVRFEHYDFPGGTREGDVHIFGKIRNAWFKDPDGNILSIVSER